MIEFLPLVAPGSFALLSTLEFCATLDDAIAFLQIEFAPRLTSIFLHSPQIEEACDLHQFLSCLSKARHLRLALFQFTDGPLNDIDGLETDRITFEMLEPLLAFPILVDLRVSYHRQFQLDEYHLMKLLEGWRDLECLCLCSDPLLEEVPYYLRRSST